MENITYFLLKLFVSSAILLLYYWVALRNKQFHYYNRFYLLLSTAISLIIPFLRLQWFTVSSPNQHTVVFINSIQNGEVLTPTLILRQTTDPALFIYCGWGILSSIMLLLLMIRILKLLKIKTEFPNMEMDHFTFINTNLPQAPFSFLKNLFWREDILLEENEGKQILQHELAHIRQKHSYDQLFMQVVLAIFWINPVYWLIRKELYLIHEFIADEEAVEDKDAKAFAAMLLHSAYGKRMFSPAQSFSYSPIKRRLAMLTTPKNARRSYLQKLMVLPLLTIIIGLFAFRMEPTEIQKKETLNKLQTEASSRLFTLADLKKNAMRRLDTITPRNYGTYKGQPVKSVLVKPAPPKVIVTTKDGKKHEMTMEEAKQNKILVPPPPPPARGEPEIVVTGHKMSSKQRITTRLDAAGATRDLSELVIIVDGKKVDQSELNNIEAKDISSINIIKGEVLSKYGEEGKKGVIEVTTKKAGNKSSDQELNLNLETQPGQEPAFPGGETDWKKFLQRNMNINVPVDNGAPPGSYKVTLEFLVGKDGTVSDVHAINNPGYGTAEEAVRLINRGPKWVPAKLNGEPVAYRKRQPVTFVVSED
ncbi:MAG: hypothetical protein JWN76_134 [Chitinophagaceae bacterium]|nr:hypothetical protein [Chitinophagaceae bacterium]